MDDEEAHEQDRIVRSAPPRPSANSAVPIFVALLLRNEAVCCFIAAQVSFFSFLFCVLAGRGVSIEYVQ